MEGEDEIWPPPPIRLEPDSEENGVIPFRRGSWRTKGSFSDFVTGTIEISSEGILISGKTRVRQEIQIPILLCCYLALMCAPCLFIVLGGLFDEMFLKNTQILVPWSDVDSVVFDEAQQVVCLVYRAPNYYSITKTYCLAFHAQAAPCQYLLDRVTSFAADRVVVQRVKAGFSFAMIAIIIWLLGVILLMVISSIHR